MDDKMQEVSGQIQNRGATLTERLSHAGNYYFSYYWFWYYACYTGGGGRQ